MGANTMPGHQIYRDQWVVVTTLNNDSFHGFCVWTTRHEMTLRKVSQLTGEGKIPLDGSVTVMAQAIVWVQIPDVKEDGEHS